MRRYLPIVTTDAGQVIYALDTSNGDVVSYWRPRPKKGGSRFYDTR